MSYHKPADFQERAHGDPTESTTVKRTDISRGLQREAQHSMGNADLRDFQLKINNKFFLLPLNNWNSLGLMHLCIQVHRNGMFGDQWWINRSRRRVLQEQSGMRWSLWHLHHPTQGCCWQRCPPSDNGNESWRTNTAALLRFSSVSASLHTLSLNTARLLLNSFKHNWMLPFNFWYLICWHSKWWHSLDFSIQFAKSCTRQSLEEFCWQSLL